MRSWLLFLWAGHTVALCLWWGGEGRAEARRACPCSQGPVASGVPTGAVKLLEMAEVLWESRLEKLSSVGLQSPGTETQTSREGKEELNQATLKTKICWCSFTMINLASLLVDADIAYLSQYRLYLSSGK